MPSAALARQDFLHADLVRQPAQLRLAVLDTAGAEFFGLPALDRMHDVCGFEMLRLAQIAKRFGQLTRPRTQDKRG